MDEAERQKLQDECVGDLISRLNNTGRIPPFRPASGKFTGYIKPDGTHGLGDFLAEVKDHCDQYGLDDTRKARIIFENCEGPAKQELLTVKASDRSDPAALVSRLRGRWASHNLATFYSRFQNPSETPGQYFCALERLFDSLVGTTTPTDPTLKAMFDQKNNIIMNQIKLGLGDRLVKNNIISSFQDLTKNGSKWETTRERIMVLCNISEQPMPATANQMDSQWYGYGQTQQYAPYWQPGYQFQPAPPPTLGATAFGATATPQALSSPLQQVLEGQQRMIALMEKLVEVQTQKGPPDYDSSSIRCNYCKGLGHMLKDCRKLMAKREREGQTPNPHDPKNGSVPGQ